jgi:hypothetical protein
MSGQKNDYFMNAESAAEMARQKILAIRHIV